VTVVSNSKSFETQTIGADNYKMKNGRPGEKDVTDSQ